MKIYMLIGIPGCGKSTWIKKYLAENYRDKPYTIMGIDFLRTKYQEMMREIVDPNFVYDRQNKNVEPFIKRTMSVEVVLSAIEQGKDLFLDNMNLERGRRAWDIQKMKEVAEKNGIDVEFIAVYFDADPEVCWKRISECRVDGDINNIPEEIFWKNVEKLEFPEIEEGYSEIVYAI